MLVTVWIIFYVDLSQGDCGSKKQEQYWRLHFEHLSLRFRKETWLAWLMSTLCKPVRIGLHLNWQKGEQRSLCYGIVCFLRMQRAGFSADISSGVLSTHCTHVSSHYWTFKSTFLFLTLINLSRLFCSKDLSCIRQHFWSIITFSCLSVRRAVATSHVSHFGYVL